MVSFNGRPSSAASALPVLKVASKTKARLIVQSDDVVVINTHWLGRRLWCTGDGCPGCAKSTVRSVAYFCCLIDIGQELRPILIETSLQELARLNGFVEMERMTFKPGLVLEATRNKPKSPMRLEPVEMRGDVLELLRPVHRALSAAAILAGLPPCGSEEPMESYRRRVMPIARLMLERATA